MGRYNFDKIVDRKHTKSLKYDFAVQRGKPADVLPFWVADMDFEIPSELKQVLLDRVNHGIFGYTESDDAYFNVLKDTFPSVSSSIKGNIFSSSSKWKVCSIK